VAASCHARYPIPPSDGDIREAHPRLAADALDVVDLEQLAAGHAPDVVDLEQLAAGDAST